MASADEQVLSARWIFPVTSEPLSRGTITIRGDRIVSVDPHGSRTPDIDFGNAAILPGLVNAHCHLDLTGMRGKTPPSSDFVGWLRGVIEHRMSQSPEQSTADIHAGLAECMRFGTTLIGDIASGGSSWNTLVESRIWAVCYRELIGLSSARVHQVWSELCDWMNAHPDTPTCRAAVSPHAPYSVHRALIEAAARLWPVCIHLAESLAEQELLSKKTGPFVSLLKDRGVWDQSGLVPSVDWVVWKTSRAPSALLAHGNYLSSNTSIPPHATVVYCPRTHAAFGHSPHPFRELMNRGVRIAIGTDSLASNPDLDVLAEARFIRERYPDVPGEQLLRMATINGAEALGFGMTTGSLEPGKSADLVVVPIAVGDVSDPYETILLVDGTNRRTMWRGHWRG